MRTRLEAGYENVAEALDPPRGRDGEPLDRVWGDLVQGDGDFRGFRISFCIDHHF